MCVSASLIVALVRGVFGHPALKQMLGGGPTDHKLGLPSNQTDLKGLQFPGSPCVYFIIFSLRTWPGCPWRPRLLSWAEPAGVAVLLLAVLLLGPEALSAEKQEEA